MKKHYTLLQAACVVLCSIVLCAPLNAQTPIINTIAGNGLPAFAGDGGLAIDASFDPPTGIAVNSAGNTVYVADELNHRIRRISVGSTTINTVAGNAGLTMIGTTMGAYSGDGGPAVSAGLNAPFGVAVDTSGNVYIADNQNYRIRKVNTAGIITTIAGTGLPGYSGDGIQATTATIGHSHGITTDRAGNIYFSDIDYNVVRKIDATGIISTVAGNGVAGFSGDGSLATNAKLNTPRGIRVDGSGNLFIADVANNRVRKVNTAGIISTIAGGGFGLDGVPATAAGLLSPWDVATDAAGNIYIADYGHNEIRIVNTSGIISYVAGSDTAGFSGDGCAVDSAKTNSPMYLALDSAGDIFFSDEHNYRVRIITKNHAPSFIAGHSQSLTICADTAVNINTLLAAADIDVRQPEEWTVLTAAAHGTLVGAYYDTSTGAAMTPIGLSYTPAAGYVGTDLFTIVITDCTGASDTTTVNITLANCSLGSPAAAIPAAGGLAVYPNPNGGTFTVNVASGANETVSVTITDVLGKKIKEVTTVTNKPAVIAAGMAPGIYFLSAATSSGVYNAKMLVR